MRVGVFILAMDSRVTVDAAILNDPTEECGILRLPTLNVSLIKNNRIGASEPGEPVQQVAARGAELVKARDKRLVVCAAPRKLLGRVLEYGVRH